MLLGAPYLHIGLRILVTFQEKVVKAFTFLVLPEMEVRFVLGLKASYSGGNYNLMPLTVQGMKLQAESGMDNEASFA